MRSVLEYETYVVKHYTLHSSDQEPINNMGLHVTAFSINKYMKYKCVSKSLLQQIMLNIGYDCIPMRLLMEHLRVTEGFFIEDIVRVKTSRIIGK